MTKYLVIHSCRNNCPHGIYGSVVHDHFHHYCAESEIDISDDDWNNDVVPTGCPLPDLINDEEHY